jgi:hypothetical protein
MASPVAGCRVPGGVTNLILFAYLTKIALFPPPLPSMGHVPRTAVTYNAG